MWLVLMSDTLALKIYGDVLLFRNGQTFKQDMGEIKREKKNSSWWILNFAIALKVDVIVILKFKKSSGQAKPVLSCLLLKCTFLHLILQEGRVSYSLQLKFLCTVGFSLDVLITTDNFDWVVDEFLKN